MGGKCSTRLAVTPRLELEIEKILKYRNQNHGYSVHRTKELFPAAGVGGVSESQRKEMNDTRAPGRGDRKYHPRVAHAW